MGANRLEKFENVVINRQDIHGADYNPRKISENAKKKIRGFLRTHGLWCPLIVNKQTMTLVGGHQRLEAMDMLLRKPDYELTVSMIDVDEETEVKGNVFLNNPSAQGEWDIFKLEGLKEIFPELDYEKDLGFDAADIDIMFGTTFKTEKEEKEAEELTQDYFREAKKASRDKAREENTTGNTYQLEDIDYTVTFVFPNNREKQEFMRKIRKDPKEKHLKASLLFDIYNGIYNLSNIEEA